MSQRGSISVSEPATQLVFGLVILYLVLIPAFAALFTDYKNYFEVFIATMQGGNAGAEGATFGKQFSKSVMFISGLVCSFFFFLSFYIFFFQYVSQVWNKYFFSSEDDWRFTFLVVAQMLDYGAVIYAPHFWYLSVAGIYFCYMAILGHQFHTIRRRISSKTGEFGNNDPSELEKIVHKHFGKREGSRLLCQFVLIRFCFRRFVYFGLFFGSPFIVVMLISHFFRGRIGDFALALLLAGSYAAAAVLFTLLFSFYFVLRLAVMHRTGDRLMKKDYDYFMPTAR